MNILIIILLFIWQLPQNIIALVMMPFLGKMKLVKHYNYAWAFKCSKMSGGISLGNFIFLSENCARREASIMHEFGHVKDSHMFGPLYLFIIGIPSIFWAWLKPSDKCYYSFYTEKRANKNAGVEVGYRYGRCYIYLP